MKRERLFLLAAGLLSAVGVAVADVKPFRQVYDLDAKKALANESQVKLDLKNAPATLGSAPAVWYAVPAMGDIKRVPDAYPTDGRFLGDLQIIAAKGEFEPASFEVYPLKDADRFELKASDLVSKSGAKIPGSALDLKLVKVWYQCGSGWFGYMADPLRRVLTPELLVNDEAMIKVDCKTKDNYARYDDGDGSKHYEWISADFQVTDYKFSNMARIGMIHDADTLQPVVLNKGEFKQFMVTAHVPRDAADGLYSGKIDLVADGKVIGSIPVRLGVLPFELPEPRTNYDLNKPFYLALYGTGSTEEYVIRDLVNHNARHMFGFPRLQANNEEEFVRQIALAKKLGVETKPLFANAYGASAQKDLEAFKKEMKAAVELCKKHLGHSEIYCYGADEGGPWTIKGERPTWQAVHEAGAKVMVSTHAHRDLLYNLDYMVLPRMPNSQRAEEVRKFHEAHPDGLCGWYADPHSGPENPDYFRRIHGIMSYKGNYDVASNYTWYRNDWNDFAIAYEPNYRGIIMVYAIADRILDTLAWEGVREGVDDIRYATKVKMLAAKAEASGNGPLSSLGRQALSYISYYDTRDSIDGFRAECINYIVRLESALKELK